MPYTVVLVGSSRQHGTSAEPKTVALLPISFNVYQLGHQVQG